MIYRIRQRPLLLELGFDESVKLNDEEHKKTVTVYVPFVCITLGRYDRMNNIKIEVTKPQLQQPRYSVILAQKTKHLLGCHY
ncbi:hypothetical protein HanRHA438_Chr11g0486891 [Helianthus annuus]|nr:hypothetical protein HanRHA438_Chr11g0486891 [Helianthus annuus]